MKIIIGGGKEGLRQRAVVSIMSIISSLLKCAINLAISFSKIRNVPQKFDLPIQIIIP